MLLASLFITTLLAQQPSGKDGTHEISDSLQQELKIKRENPLNESVLDTFEMIFDVEENVKRIASTKKDK